MVSSDRWYSVKEVAELIGYSRDTVVRLVQKGYLKAFCLPTRGVSRRRVYLSRRILGSEIIRFLAENTKAAA
jgi:excisionase family DNA binding protein